MASGQVWPGKCLGTPRANPVHHMGTAWSKNYYFILHIFKGMRIGVAWKPDYLVARRLGRA